MAGWVLAGLLIAGAHAGPSPLKVLRVAFPTAENGFDPARIDDTYSSSVTVQIFESLYAYDYLAVPAKVRPLTAAALPEPSADFRTWTIKVRPGIYFTDDPAFKGVRRELVAQDYVYSYKRFSDPAVRSPQWAGILGLGITGLAGLREESLRRGKPFDYDREIPGLRALDRYTLQFRLDAPRPRLPLSLIGAFRGAVAREVVEGYGDRIMEHPVGTGPFKLGQWRRSSLIVLDRNPGFRAMTYDAEPAADDREGQNVLARLKGRKLPMVDRVEISIIDEGQPRWLAFLGGKLDQIDVPPEFLPQAVPARRLAPYLEKRGIRASVVTSAVVSYLYFNMNDPLVGGYSPERVALRRAIGLAMDVPRQIDVIRGGLAAVAHSPISAYASGYDPAFRSEIGEFNRSKAKALLDLYGYIDRKGTGWRQRPDGTPLVLRLASEPGQISRQFDELFQSDMKAIGLRVAFDIAQWPEHNKAARAGALMMWQLGYGPITPDGVEALERLYGPAAGGYNLSRFDLPAMNTLYERLLAMPDGPERDALFVEAKRLAVAYMPEKTTLHRMSVYLSQPWLVGYRPKPFQTGWYHMVDIDAGASPEPAVRAETVAEVDPHR
ncbi:MAG TPA: ABC transporter substrate-binding protein [Caldimonas sp.]|nr:ABC transporter substrate-binding protein [Caldimonas sp.]